MECVVELLAQNSCGLGLVPGSVMGGEQAASVLAIEKSTQKKIKKIGIKNWKINSNQY